MFLSEFKFLGHVELPVFSGTRVMMLPFKIEDLATLPDSVKQYRKALELIIGASPIQAGTGYLTIDEKRLPAGQTHRREGLHVDGVFRNGGGSWGGGGWGAPGTGMLTVASHVGCQAWNQKFEGWPGDEGDCEHLRDELGESTVFQAGELYWLDGLCVHESLAQVATVSRQFVRLSLPSNAPWFDGYTVNPLGVLPAGPILPRREFMDS